MSENYAALPDRDGGLRRGTPLQDCRAPRPRLDLTLRWREMDSNLYGAFPVKWCFSIYCQFFVRSGKAVLHPVAYDQVPGARAMGVKGPKR